MHCIGDLVWNNHNQAAEWTLLLDVEVAFAMNLTPTLLWNVKWLSQRFERNVDDKVGHLKALNDGHDHVYGAVIVIVHCHCESSPGSSADECSTQRQVAVEMVGRL